MLSANRSQQGVRILTLFSPQAVARRSLAVALLGTVSMHAVPAFAQDNDGQYWLARKNQIVVSATRGAPVLAADVPVTISVIDAEKIADELATDIRDLIRFEPGVSVRRAPARFNAAGSSLGRAGNEGFNIRGIGGNRVLIQMDGIRVPDGFSFGAQSAGRGDYVDLGLIKSVEILRGPSSALYGSDGLAGAVSFVTAGPQDFLTQGRDFGGVLRTSYASADNEFTQSAILAGRSGDWSAMAAYTRRDMNELKNKGRIGGTGATRTKANPQDGHSNAALARLVYDPSNGHKLRLTGEYMDNYLFTDGISNLSNSVDLLQAKDNSDRKRLSLDWTWEGDGTLRFARVATYWQDGEDRQFTDEDRTSLADRERLNIFENRVFGMAADARLEFDSGPIHHAVTFGGDFSKTRQRGLRDGVTPPAGEVYPTRAFPVTDFTRAGLFVGDEISLMNGQLLLYPALRFDWYDLSPRDDTLLGNFQAAAQDGSRLSPKFGAVWKVTDELRFFANYGTGFKAPEPGQVNQFFENLTSPYFAYRTIANPNLKPERSTSFEGGLRYNSDAVSLDITGFSARYQDFISQEEVGGTGLPADPLIYQFINLDRVRIKGAEARFEARASSGLYGTVSLAYAHGNILDGSGAKTPLDTIDPLKLVGGVGYRAPSGRFGGQIIMTHSQRKEANRAEGSCSGGECYRPDGFTILDVTAFAKLTEALTLRAGVFNILDKKYSWWSDVRGQSLASMTSAAAPQLADAFTQPGRNASISVSYRF